jgi:ubiquinone biosynthesis protein COQ9
MLTQIDNEKLYDRMRVRDKISYAVRTRLETLALHREPMRQLCLWYALPHHAPEAVKNMARLCDIIWRAAGDTSTDFNFYSKRALLAYVIKTTTLFWLTDDSEGQKASWEFLDRRIAEVLQIGKMTSQLRDLPKHLSKINTLAGFAKRFRNAD